jgi:hypothetical protein
MIGSSPLTSIEVHCNIRQIQLLQGIIGALQIGVLSIGAFGHIQIGHQIRQAIRLCKKSVSLFMFGPIEKLHFPFRKEGRKDSPITRIV